jgi:hypothetical protein
MVVYNRSDVGSAHDALNIRFLANELNMLPDQMLFW